MAYNIPEKYQDLTPAQPLDKKTLNKMVWLSCFLQASFNYERMQACGWLWSMLPGLQKIHTNKEDLKASMAHNLDFLNTHPFLVTFVMGIVLSLEQNKADTHHFWQEFRKAVKEANPEAIILAEHYGNTRDWLQGNEWDTVMNYDAFMEPVTWFLTGMEKHSDDYREDLLGNAESFWGAMRHHTSSFSMPSWQVAMNELSNHDHSRFLAIRN